MGSAVYTVRRASVADLYDVCMIEENSFDDPYPRVLLAELLRRCPASFVAVDVDGRVVGYCVSSIRAEEAHLISIAVLRSRRRIGIAQTLINELKRFLSDRGVMTLFLEVRVDNGTAIRLYSRLGFRRVRILDRYYSNGASALKMQIGLNMSSTS
ncbi:MAG: ribosomal protein S18-alanine N-acetyltransferase [Candidatus Bathyarchaeia archaeon]